MSTRVKHCLEHSVQEAAAITIVFVTSTPGWGPLSLPMSTMAPQRSSLPHRVTHPPSLTASQAQMVGTSAGSMHHHWSRGHCDLLAPGLPCGVPQRKDDIHIA